MRAGRGRLAEVIALRGGQADPEAPFVIEHREALIDMLCEAAELEHGIMCQYLFAAFSLREREDEGLTASEQNIKPLFRERDRESMKFAFDPADQVATFRQWVESGKA
jgi:hypothetical protein